MIDLSLIQPALFRDLYQGMIAQVPLRVDTLYTIEAYLLRDLQQALQNFHRITQHIPINNDVVIGSGICQITCATLYSISKCHPHHRIVVTSEIPYYPFLQGIVEGMGKNFVFIGTKLSNDNTLIYDNDEDCNFELNRKDLIVQVVVSPSNPQGRANRAHTHLVHKTNQMPISYILWDASYAWPCYASHTSIQSLNTYFDSLEIPCIAMFSLSKSMGLAGQRLGYAVFLNCKDRSDQWTTFMNEYIIHNTMGFCQSGILFATSILKGVDVVRRIWPKVINIISDRQKQIKSMVRSIASVESAEGMPFLFLKMKDENIDAVEYFARNFGWNVMGGTKFGLNKHWARVNLLYSFSCNISDGYSGSLIVLSKSKVEDVTEEEEENEK